MKRILLVLLVAAAVVAAVLIFVLRSKPAPQGATLVSDSTLLFAEVPDYRRAQADFHQTALYELWREPEVQAFMEEPRRALGALLGNENITAEENKARDAILDAIQGEMFAAITRIAVIPSPQVDAVFGVDTKGSLLKAKAALAYYEHELRTRHSSAKFDSKRYLGVTYSIWELQRNQTVCHAFLNSMLVFTTGENSMRDVITRFTGHAPANVWSLAASDKYQNVLGHLPPARHFVAYLNAEQVVSLVGPFLALMPQTAAAYEKMSRVRDSAWSFAFADKQIYDVGFTAFTLTNKPLPATQRKTLALTTPQTSVYAVQSMDVGAFYQQFVDSVAQSSYEALVSKVAGFDRQLRNAGVRPRDDLFAYLGPETATIGTWRDGASLPDAAIVVEIRNPGQTRARIDLGLHALKDAGLGNDAQHPWDDTQYLGETLHTIHLGASLVAPTYVTTDTLLILALTPDYARELLGQLKQSKPTLDSSAAYRQAMGRLPDAACAYGFYDLGALFRPLYTRLRTSVTDNNLTVLPGLNKLPQTDTIARHLAPVATATVTDDKSQTSTSYSSLGKPITLLITGAGVMALAQPYWAQYLPILSQVAPRTSSGMAGPLRPPGNQTGASQNPPTR